jgi:fructose/tagatose bisphosphate aldolase
VPQLLTGRQLKRVFNYFCPFESDGQLKPEQQRVTILASNANIPMDIQARAFVMAAAQGKQSPMIIQLSYNSINTMGGAARNLKPLDGVKRSEVPGPTIEGAEISFDLIERFVRHYGAKHVAVSLDHFNVPKFDEAVFSGSDVPKTLEAELARDKIGFAIDYMRQAFGDPQVPERTINAYVNYLTNAEYRGFRKDFVDCVRAINPAWGMIDTEKLPPVLDFVVTRDVSDAVKGELGNADMMIEAEFGATGQSGQEIKYESIRGPQLERFADQVASFVSYTGAEGIAYPIGMAHAAKIGEKHEADVERLTAVQRTLYLKTGQYIPFAQHGGTGAASVIRGLVAKDNINTRYLVVGAIAFADHYDSKKDAVRAGDKNACGTGIYTNVIIPAIAKEAVEKLKETGSYQKGEELDRL